VPVSELWATFILEIVPLRSLLIHGIRESNNEIPKPQINAIGVNKNGGLISKTQFSRRFTALWIKFCKMKLYIHQWRQAITGFTEKHCPRTSVTAEQVTLAEQAGHSFTTAQINYAHSSSDPKSMSRFQFEIFRQMTQNFHVMIGFNEAPTKKSSICAPINLKNSGQSCFDST
jgi:hypothetical protein